MDTYEQYKARYKDLVKSVAPHEVTELTTQEEVTFEALTRPLEAR